MARRTKKGLIDPDSDSDVIIPQELDENVLVRWFLRPRILVVVAACAALYIASPHLVGVLPELSQRPEYQLKAEQIRFTAPPPWIPRTFLQQVIREGELPEELSLLDNRVIEQVVAAFQRNPWVERVVSGRKDVSQHLTVVLEYRKPVAVVVTETDRFPIDKNAVLLPPPELDPSVTELPLIRNARAAPQARVGSPWGDRTVEGAARLAEVLAPNWKKLKLESIEIPDVTAANSSPDKIIYALRTVGGSRIIWGRAPGTDRPGELTPEQKIGRLEEYVTHHGGFGTEETPYEIDIRHWKDILLRPLSGVPGNVRQ